LVSEVSFPDHHSYAAKDMEGVEEKAKEAGAEFIVTTEKDAVKIELFKDMMGMPIYYLEIGLNMNGNEERFINAILAGIQG